MRTVKTTTAAGILALAVCLSLSPAHAAPLAYGYVGLFADSEHSICSVISPGGFLPFTVWVWWYPGDTGMTFAEFMLSYPASVIRSTIVTHPGITTSVGDMGTGVQVTYGQCQNGWTWTHYQQCYLMSTAPALIQVVPYPPTGARQFASCEAGNPFYTATTLTNLYLNMLCSLDPIDLPVLTSVTVTGAASVRAFFDMCVAEADIYPQHFILINRANQADTIHANQATRVDYSAYDLTLEKVMTQNTTYQLLARMAVWSCYYPYSNYSMREFTYYGPIATQETSWGAIKALFGD